MVFRGKRGAMQSINEILQNRIKTKGSERNSVLKEIYFCYENDKTNRRKENWKRYCKWCRDWKLPNNKESENKFKKSKFFIKELSPKVLAIKLAHIPTKDLYYVRSVAKDKYNRGENVGAFILGSIKINQ